MLKATIDEPSFEVKKHILQLVAVLAKHEQMRGEWRELFCFIEAFIESSIVNEREVLILKNCKTTIMFTHLKLIIVLFYAFTVWFIYNKKFN